MNDNGNASEAAPEPFDASGTRLAIDHELDLVETAAAFVLSGGAPRVTLAGLSFGRQLLARNDRERFGARIRLVPIWHLDGSGCDIAVTADG